jgi:uncharacterized protein YegP (UPF0339 family)
MDRPRDGQGKFLESPGTAERDAEALRMRSRGHSFETIAQTLGYGHRANAQRAIKRAVAALQKEPAEEIYAQQIENLNNMRRAVYAVLEKNHVVVQNGRIIFLDKFNPLIDYKPVLEAVDRLLKIEDRFAKLHNLDQHTLKVDLTYQNETDVAIRKLLDELDERVKAQEQEIRRG